ncbi:MULTISPECIES: sensor histidine kinase [unclassified Corallococcus]|uniref:sensor histidine kinase n=1 Tax=unclassified Corallococcus TaxID=2685029 RepID=UPI001A8D209B|nr:MULTISPECIES: PAS domain S-box protein [unclassified Corallococcus]MBN9682691.1 PAS domain S-box protein [Corallococcus sp. NCSPR001]WAS85766.1 PAS domain S-box protein [Corallococcus sp. NCRR]
MTHPPPATPSVPAARSAPPWLKRGLVRFIAGASAFAVLVGALLVDGWALSLFRASGRPFPWDGWGLVFEGGALWLLHTQTARKGRRLVGRGLATGGVVMGITGLTQETPGGGMGLLLMGLSLWAVHVRTRQGGYPARWLATGVGLISVWGVIGGLYQGHWFGLAPLNTVTGWPRGPGLPLSLALWLLSVGLLALHPDRGLTGVLLREDLGGHSARRLLFAVLLVVPAVGAVRLLGERLGLYGTTEGVTLFVLLTMAAFLAVVLWNANALSRLDASRRRVEHSLRLSEARFGGIVTHAADAIISIDAEQRIVLFNASAERIFGYSGQEVLGQPLDILLPEQLRAVHAAHVRRFARGAATSRHMGERLPILGRRRGGETFPAEASIMKLDVEGTQRLTVILRDISARRKAEDLLRLSEERFRTSFEGAPVGMALVDLDGHFLHVNAALCDLVGYSREELLHRSFQDLTAPEDLPVDVANAERMRRGELASFQREKHYVRKDGRRIAILVWSAVVRDARGMPLHFISQMHDITERQELEQAWRFLADVGPRLAASLSSRTTLATVARLAVPALADWCVVACLDAKGDLQRVEFAAADARTAERLRALEAAHGPECLVPAPLIAAARRTGRPVLVPEVPPGVSGAAEVDAGPREPLPLRSALVLPLHGRERNLGVILLAASGDGRRYGARERAQAEELARRAALAIDNAGLYERAEQAIRMREEVLRIVAHDLRTPLNVIQLSARMLEKHLPPDDGARPRLDTLQKSVQRANRLIQDLLDVARMEGGSLSVERKPLEVAPLIQEALEQHRGLAEARALLLQAHVPEGVPRVLADPERLAQILSNLLGNALKFTPEGGRVLLRVQPEVGQVRFLVSDTGPGIAAEDRPRIFERFWQAGPKRKEGAGLGLAIVKGLVEAHGGQVGVDSAPGAGSTFFFTLPTADGAQAHAGTYA